MTVESLPNLTRLVRQCWEPIPANTDENDQLRDKPRRSGRGRIARAA